MPEVALQRRHRFTWTAETLALRGTLPTAPWLCKDRMTGIQAAYSFVGL